MSATLVRERLEGRGFRYRGRIERRRRAAGSVLSRMAVGIPCDVGSAEGLLGGVKGDSSRHGPMIRGRGERRNWAELREAMVREQLERRGIKDPLVLRSMRRVPRHEFVPENVRSSAYDDSPLPIGEGQTISQPYMVALMTETLHPRGDEKVLEVGTGSGYQAAILAEMGCRVYTIERDPRLAREAEVRLGRLGYSTVAVREGDGTLGWPEESPFQAIIVTAGGPRVPESLKNQLDPLGGVLAIPVGDRGYQDLMRVVRKGDRFVETNLGGCRFVPLVGEEGW